MRGDDTSVRRITQLDGLRGLAALGVMVFHYQHFGGDKALYPYAATSPTIGWLYLHGWMLVDFFFLLSGVVITRKYLDLVATRRLSRRTFFWLRFSRVYPLHLLTLLFVAALQWGRVWFLHPYVLYPQNDLYHFVLNLGLLQAGVVDEGFSFNGPSWSIGVEMMVYLVFFQIAKLRGAHFASAAAVAFVGALVVCGMTLPAPGVTLIGVYPIVNSSIGRAVLGFFGGSLCYLGLLRASELGLSRRIGYAALAALAAMFVAGKHFENDAFIGGMASRAVLHYGLTLFPLVLVAALEVRPLGWLLSLWPLKHLGDISYAMYLLHVPLQMALLTYAEWKHITLPTERPLFLVTFTGTVLVLATVTHYFFEVPARAWLRRRLALSAAPS
ncbi:MAG TPA: acyltransferase [Polyangiaceae bacterium]|nr:acyltransferase [Polyangiaceae bacterium]